MRIAKRQIAFNRVCVIASFFWLFTTIPVGIVWRPVWTDFTQFYVGGILAAAGEWDALYPITREGELDNPGLSSDSDEKPRWDAVRRRHLAPDGTHFILPPPSALLFTPLSFTMHKAAFWIWTSALIGSVFGVSVMTASLYRAIVGRETRAEGFLMLLVAMSPMTARAIRIANVSPLISLTICVSILALIDHRKANSSFPGGAALALGAMMKYATLILTPLLVVMRQWRMLVWMSFIALFALALTLMSGGKDAMIEFMTRILPTLSRPSTFDGNQSLPGLLVRVFGRPLPADVSLALTILRLSSLAIVFAILFLMPKQGWMKATNVIAGAAILLSWLLMFSPIAWEHWPIFLCPAWGWILVEAKGSKPKRVAAIASLVLMAIPAGIFNVHGFFTFNFRLPEPLNSTQLAGVALVFGLSFRALTREIRSLRI